MDIDFEHRLRGFIRNRRSAPTLLGKALRLSTTMYRLWQKASLSSRVVYRDSKKKIQLFVNRGAMVFEVPIDVCVNILGFSFAPDGWHFLIELLKEYDTNAALKPEESILFRYHQSYQPEGTFDMVKHLGLEVTFRPPFGIYPWGNFRIRSDPNDIRPKDQYKSRFCGPSDPSRLQGEFSRMIALYEQIKKEGYRPWRHDFISGTVFRSRSGELRFVVIEGNHRLAILSHLGVKSARVSYLPNYHQIIDEHDVDNWSYVRSGECTVEDALCYFNAFFELNGLERAQRMGLAM